MKDKALELFDQFAGKLDSLLAEKDYLDANDPEFREGLEVLKEDFEKAVKDYETPFADLLDQVDAHDDHDCDSILDRLDKEDISDYLESDGYFFVKIEGLHDRDKLQDFINQNIYPYNINLL